MPHKDSLPFGPPESRRQFIKKTGVITVAVAGANLFQLPVSAATKRAIVAIALDPASDLAKQAPVKWAVEHLAATLAARGLDARIFNSVDESALDRESIFVCGPSSPTVREVLDTNGVSRLHIPESFAIARRSFGKRRPVIVTGSDTRGMVFALLELADRVACAHDPITALSALAPVVESPANSIRSISRAFVSDLEDKSWFYDREFWSRYLTMLATNRFNRFSLTLGIGYDFTTNITDCYFHFAYPFLLSVPGYDVRAVPLPDSERDLNLETLRFISEETARRGMHFQLGLWTHAYKWTNSPRANYTIEGLATETHAPYCRDALRALLTACPAISGITFRIHGESGVPEGNYDLWKTIFDGVAQCGRKVEIDMHAKGMDQGMINVALGTGQPVNISPKFWAEHMGLPYMQGSIRALEMPPRDARATGFFSRSSGSRSFLRYGYGDLLAEDRRYGIIHRIWPGTQRLLLWGDPETAAAYGRVASFCGSNGVEIQEPLFFKGRKGSGLPGGRDGYADTTLKPKFDFEKYDYTYRIWGGNLYCPGTDGDGWRRLLRKQCDRAANHVESALASAGKILPLITTAHCPSAANNNYWPEMYFNMAIVDPSRRNPYGDTPSPKRFGTVSPLDPEFFLSCDECADELLKREHGGKYSPVWVADRLEHQADQALAQLRKAKVRETRSPEFRRVTADVKIQVGLGKFFAAKFRAGVLFSIFLRTNHPHALDEALKAYRAVRSAWVDLSTAATGVYREDVTFGPEYFQRGHWSDRLTAIDADIADMEKLSRQKDGRDPATKADRETVERAIAMVLKKSTPDEGRPFAGFHEPQMFFKRGEPLEVAVHVPRINNFAMITEPRVRYRRVNQAEIWRTAEMTMISADNSLTREYRAVIPADYTDSAFPLQYYFQLGDGSYSWLLPSLERPANGQPYFVVRQT